MEESMKKIDAIDKIHEEIFNCSKCCHMVSPGKVILKDQYGKEYIKPFRPDIPGWFNNQEIACVGINPGYDYSWYPRYEEAMKLSSFNEYCKQTNEIFKQLENEDKVTSPYPKKMLEDVKNILECFKEDKEHLSIDVNQLLQKISNSENANVADLIYYLNAVQCSSIDTTTGKICEIVVDDKTFELERNIDLNSEFEECHSYLFRMINIAKPKLLCMYINKFYSFSSYESVNVDEYQDESLEPDKHIVDFFTFSENNTIVQIFEKAKSRCFSYKYGNGYTNCLASLVKYADGNECIVLILPYPSRDSGERHRKAIATMCNSIKKESNEW